MSVLVRTKRGESSIRKRRLRPAGRSGEAAAQQPVESAPSTATAEIASGSTTTTVKRTNGAAPGRRRELGPLQDQALYTCQCGFVFKAPVSTSVGCPNCGDTQAW